MWTFAWILCGYCVEHCLESGSLQAMLTAWLQHQPKPHSLPRRRCIPDVTRCSYASRRHAPVPSPASSCLRSRSQLGATRGYCSFMLPTLLFVEVTTERLSKPNPAPARNLGKYEQRQDLEDSTQSPKPRNLAAVLGLVSRVRAL